VGLAKGKKQHDKRETERVRDTQREIQSAMKQNRR
jgi:SsrA-binding protein